MLVHYTSRALFCQSVIHDELEDRCHGCGIELFLWLGGYAVVSNDECIYIVVKYIRSR
jgi:hypothetical protein